MFQMLLQFCSALSINTNIPYIILRWGQVFILDSVSNYIPKDEREAQSICERVTPRLAHANSAIVLSAVKVCLDKIRRFFLSANMHLDIKNQVKKFKNRKSEFDKKSKCLGSFGDLSDTLPILIWLTCLTHDRPKVGNHCY